MSIHPKGKNLARARRLIWICILGACVLSLVMHTTSAIVLCILYARAPDLNGMLYMLMVLLAFSCVEALLLGGLSCLYVVPLLSGTRLERSLPRVYGAALVAATLGGFTNHLIGIVFIYFTHFGMCVWCARSRAMARPVPESECTACGYAMTGLPAGGTCPECGVQAARSSEPRLFGEQL